MTEGTAVISVMILQNCMDLLKGELGSSSETCEMSMHDGNEVTGRKVERVNNITGRGSRASDNSSYNDRTQGKLYVCGECMHVSYRLYPELPSNVSVCPCETNILL